MAQDKEQLVDEGAMETMSVAPPDPSADASGPSGPSVSDRHEAASQRGSSQENLPNSPPPGQSGVADEDPLSAHPS